MRPMSEASFSRDLHDYLLRLNERMAFQVACGGRLVFVLPFEDDATQRRLLESEGADVELEGLLRIRRCFVMTFGAIDPEVRRATGLSMTDGVSSFENVFRRYWAQEYPDRALSPATSLLVLLLERAE